MSQERQQLFAPGVAARAEGRRFGNDVEQGVVLLGCEWLPLFQATPRGLRKNRVETLLPGVLAVVMLLVWFRLQTTQVMVADKTTVRGGPGKAARLRVLESALR